MCGRYTIVDWDQIPARFLVEPGLSETRGFHPGLFNTRTGVPPPINATAESPRRRPMFRDAIREHRCLIPADGFYEWEVVPGELRRRPVYIRRKDGGLYAFAGLNAARRNPGRGRIALDMRHNHVNPQAANDADPQPDAGHPSAIRGGLRLDRSVRDAAAIMPLLRPHEWEEIEAYPVSFLVKRCAERAT